MNFKVSILLLIVILVSVDGWRRRRRRRRRWVSKAIRTGATVYKVAKFFGIRWDVKALQQRRMKAEAEFKNALDEVHKQVQDTSGIEMADKVRNTLDDLSLGKREISMEDEDVLAAVPDTRLNGLEEEDGGEREEEIALDFESHE